MDPEAVREMGHVAHGGSDDPDLIDFSANTNPRNPDGVEAVYEGALAASRTYPPEPPERFRAAAATHVGCDPADVIPTPGGLAAIRLAIECTVRPGESVLVPAPSFQEYAREVRLQGAEPTFVPPSELLAADPNGHALAVACHPNNPTGAAYDHDALTTFAARCRDAGTPFLLDEAFLGFTDRPSLAGLEGVIVARSLTKLFGLPGLRAGFAVATGELGSALTAARPPWNLGTPARMVGTYCLGQTAFIEETRERVRTERARVRAEIEDRFEVRPSAAPFLLLDVGERDVADLLANARQEGVALRDATTFRGLDSHIRVAVRLPAENDRLIAVLEDV